MKEAEYNIRLENLKQNLARVKVLLAVFIGVIGLKFLPLKGLMLETHMLWTFVLPVISFLLLQEIHIRLQARIRIVEREWLSKKSTREALDERFLKYLTIKEYLEETGRHLD